MAKFRQIWSHWIITYHTAAATCHVATPLVEAKKERALKYWGNRVVVVVLVIVVVLVVVVVFFVPRHCCCYCRRRSRRCSRCRRRSRHCRRSCRCRRSTSHVCCLSKHENGKKPKILFTSSASIQSANFFWKFISLFLSLMIHEWSFVSLPDSQPV